MVRTVAVETSDGRRQRCTPSTPGVAGLKSLKYQVSGVNELLESGVRTTAPSYGMDGKALTHLTHNDRES